MIDLDLAISNLEQAVDLCYMAGDVDEILHLIQETIQILQYEEGY